MNNIVRFSTCILIAGLAACGDPVTSPPDSVPTDTQPPDTQPPGTRPPGTQPPDTPPLAGLPIAAPGEFPAAYQHRMAGELEVDDRGCWFLAAQYGRGLLILPPGFTSTDADTTGPVDLSGTIVYDTATLPGGSDGPWGEYATKCGVADGVVVASEFFAPAPSTVAEAALLVADLTPAALVADWPCGYGFATSTTDQRIGVTITPIGEPPPGALVTLPDERFEARVIVGSNLFANNCDDVVEWFEPQWHPTAQFSIVSGSFAYPDAKDCTGGSNVLTLTDAVVALPTGDVSLGPIEIVNESPGCFAG